MAAGSLARFVQLLHVAAAHAPHLLQKTGLPCDVQRVYSCFAGLHHSGGLGLRPPLWHAHRGRLPGALVLLDQARPREDCPPCLPL